MPVQTRAMRRAAIARARIQNRRAHRILTSQHALGIISRFANPVVLDDGGRECWFYYSRDPETQRRVIVGLSNVPRIVFRRRAPRETHQVFLMREAMYFDLPWEFERTDYHHLW